MDIRFTSNEEEEKLIKHLKRIRDIPPIRGKQWVEEVGQYYYNRLHSNLKEQGRNGAPPSLSEITKEIYAQDGEPTGEGIRNHISIHSSHSIHESSTKVGISAGKPSLIAKVQNNGATIPVTDKMRGFLAAKYGIHLRSNTKVIKIPGRQFLDNAAEETRHHAKQAFKRLFGEM